MPSQALIVELKPYIQPFERDLALRELRTVTRAEPQAWPEEGDNSYRVVVTRPLEEIVDTLTYWQAIWNADKRSLVHHTAQVRMEAAGSSRRTSSSMALPNRRELRYGPHGMHEYRGKFFPQLVGALLNLSGCRKGGTVLDPMCGSGTTIVESAARGYTALGLDFNPLSVLITNAKCDSLYQTPNDLVRAATRLRTRVLAGKQFWLANMGENDRCYIGRWFTQEALNALDSIASAIYAEPDDSIRSIFSVILSNIIRRTSLQKVDDLRVRRKADHEEPEPVYGTFFHELDRTIRSLTGYLGSFSDRKVIGKGVALEGDARRASSRLREQLGRIDVIITSPPYATALPYLDTDRLSLSFFELLPRELQRQRDFNMIGNRELTTGLAQAYWKQYYEERDSLIPEVRHVIEHLFSVNSKPGVGFRRRNLPYLLAKYFLDLRNVLTEMFTLLRPGGWAFLVVGNNSTTAGGERVDIQTDKWLGEIAKLQGFELAECLPMEMLVSRDIFKENAISRESITFLRKPA